MMNAKKGGTVPVIDLITDQFQSNVRHVSNQSLPLIKGKVSLIAFMT